MEFFRADGSYAGSVSSSSDGSWQSFGLSPGLYYVASDLSGNYLNEVYDDIPCLPFCEPLAGKPIPVALNANTPGVDFALERLGSITGTIVDSKFGVPLSSIRVEIWDESGALVRSTNSTPAGHYEAGSLLPGNYFVVTDEDGVYVDELYDDIPCPLGPPTGCNPSDGTPLPIELRTILSGVDLALDLGGSVSARVAPTSRPGIRSWARTSVSRPSSPRRSSSMSPTPKAGFSSEASPPGRISSTPSPPPMTTRSGTISLAREAATR